MKDSLIFFFNRDLDKLKKELKLYDVEDNIWKISGNISNSAGNLALHIIGNLNHYIGSEMGNTGYIRNRAAEFSLKGVSRDEILNQIEETKQTISNACSNFPKIGFLENTHWKNLDTP